MKFRHSLFIAGSIALLALLVWSGGVAWTAARRASLSSQEYEPPPPGMVFVPAGEFWMGSDDEIAEPDERPLRKVFLPAFYIDRFEVSNRRYKELVPAHRFPPGEEDLPVTHVLKSEAEEYCRRAGRRLPTGPEWEKAARGEGGRVYPWGGDFKPDYANLGRRTNRVATNAPDCQAPLAPSRGKLVGGSFPKGASPYGCHDMAGNVWEWVSDVWVDRQTIGTRSDNEPRGVLRGGAFSYSPFQARTSYQGFEALGATCHDVGFRCAMDAAVRRGTRGRE